VMAAGWDRLPVHLQSPPAFVLLALLVCNAVGYGCYRTIERPLSRWLKQRLAVRPNTERPLPLAPTQALEAR